MSIDVRPGARFTVPYPYVRDEDAGARWRPGVREEENLLDERRTIADAVGAQELEVVSLHQPGKYQHRVFFKRQWVDPDGRRFGKPGLKVATIRKFRALVAGYAHPYTVAATEKASAA